MVTVKSYFGVSRAVGTGALTSECEEAEVESELASMLEVLGVADPAKAIAAGPPAIGMGGGEISWTIDRPS